MSVHEPQSSPAMKARGTYALLLKLDHDIVCAVGRLGTFCFPAGLYVYVGSALGPGGLGARLARHRRAGKKLHWHIDYFLAHARLVDIFTDGSGQRLECAWASSLLTLPDARIPAPRFGASDCHCPAHLFYLERGEAGSQGLWDVCRASSPVASPTGS